MRQSLATRLSWLYAGLFAVTVLLVILASSIALVYQLSNLTLTGDVLYAKHQRARDMVEQAREQGQTLQVVAPDIVQRLSGFGVKVAVYDAHGHILSGDRTVHPVSLDRAVNVRIHGPETLQAGGGATVFFQRGGPFPPDGLPSVPMRTGPRTVARILYNESPGGPPPGIPRVLGFGEPPTLANVNGGFVAFSWSVPLLFASLVPYWYVVVTIALVAIVLSWLIGRFFARQALRPIDEVTDSLQALAGGDFTQRRFVMGGGDEVATLTAAYNDAVAGVTKAMDERRAVEERMRQFVADAGHELRTPLTVIGGYIDVLRRGALAEPTVAKQILGTMALEKEHMRGLIDRLMRLARLDGETPPRQEPIEVADLLRSQCDAARRLDERRQIDYSADGVGQILGDRSELGEALWNVVENALKYAPDAPIHLRAARSNGSTVITIRDEGPGMSEAERLHAFERFYRGDERGEIVGAGLGLAIAKRSVERAGGTISLDSAPGQGTTVTIRLNSQS